jgi:hypothetical protein
VKVPFHPSRDHCPPCIKLLYTLDTLVKQTTTLCNGRVKPNFLSVWKNLTRLNLARNVHVSHRHPYLVENVYVSHCAKINLYELQANAITSLVNTLLGQQRSKNVRANPITKRASKIICSSTIELWRSRRKWNDPLSW